MMSLKCLIDTNNEAPLQKQILEANNVKEAFSANMKVTVFSCKYSIFGSFIFILHIFNM